MIHIRDGYYSFDIRIRGDNFYSNSGPIPPNHCEVTIAEPGKEISLRGRRDEIVEKLKMIIQAIQFPEDEAPWDRT